MRQFSSCWLWGLFELSSSLGRRWLRAPPILTPVHETMHIFHVSSSELTHLKGLPWRGPWPPKRPALQIRTAASARGQEMCEEESGKGGVGGWCTWWCPESGRGHQETHRPGGHKDHQQFPIGFRRQTRYLSSWFPFTFPAPVSFTLIKALLSALSRPGWAFIILCSGYAACSREGQTLPISEPDMGLLI